jgi:PQQ-dependent catabolism-associated CXXCW motif protein
VGRAPNNAFLMPIGDAKQAALATLLAAALVLGAGPPTMSAAMAGDVAAGATQPAAEPQGYRMDNYRSPVPATLKGAKVLTPDAAADLWNKNAATFIDVFPQAPKPANLPAGTFWRDPVHRSIEGAHWMPNVGYGALSDAMADYFATRLERLTGSKREAPLVFFCLRDCWMSWNAAKRAVALGYTNVMWFSDGTDGWQELGYPLIDVKKTP